MLDRILSADGLTYIAIKAIRDFIMTYGVLISASTFVATPDSMKTAALAALGGAVYRGIREVFLRFEIVEEDA